MDTGTSQPEALQAARPLFVLHLYVAGSNAKSMRAVANINRLCDRYLQGCYQLDVVDLYQQPSRAKGDNIVAVPTLVKLLPLPECRVIGDLEDTKAVCDSLGIGPLFNANEGVSPDWSAQIGSVEIRNAPQP